MISIEENGNGSFFPVSRDYLSTEDGALRPAKESGVAADCNQPNYVDAVIVPSVREQLPEAESIGGRILNHLTNVYGLLSSVRRDLCDDGRIAGQSGAELLKSISRTAAAVGVSGAAAYLAGIAAAASGPLAAAGVAGAGAVALIFAPPAADYAVHRAAAFVQKLMQRTGEWIRRVQP